LFLFLHLALEISPGEEVAGVEIGDLAGHSISPLLEITRAENVSLRTRIAVLAV
jgi:hypothetical protein